MVPFVGEYRHSLDGKGRLIIPARFRSALGERIYLSKGFETCLLILTPDEIAKIQSRIMEDSLTDKAVRKFSRAFFSGMVEGNFDSQGRILIPPHLRDFAGLTGDAVIVGTGFYVEIWEKSAWDKGSAELDLERLTLSDFLGSGR